MVYLLIHHYGISMDFPGRLVAALIAVILVVLFPLQYLAKTAESNIDFYIDSSTEHLSDTIRNKGYLDTATYENYVELLNSTGEFYDIEIEDIHPVTGEEVSLYKSNNEMVSLSHNQTDVQLCSCEACTQENQEVKASSLEKRLTGGPIKLSKKSEEIQSLDTHTHTDDCYAGHRHDINCNYVYNIPTEGIVGRFRRVDGTIRGLYSTLELRDDSNVLCLKLLDNHDTNVFTITEYRSGSVYYHKELSYGSGNYGDPLYIKTRLILYNSFHVVYNYFGGIYENRQYNMRVYPGTIPQISVASCTQTQDDTPICNQVVTSITPTNPIQTVKKGESIITTATATYLDGHTGIVNCTSNINTDVGGLQMVTLTYSGLVGNAKTTGTRTCAISVTVITKTLTSISVTPTAQIIWRRMQPYFTVSANYSDGTSTILGADQYFASAFNPEAVGHQQLTISYTEGTITRSVTFEAYVDDLQSITVTPSILTVDRYTKQTALPITVTANAMYNPSWNVTGGHTISGYSPDKIGLQTVTVSYKHYETTRTAQIQVNVTALHKVCPRCGNTYELNGDDTDPGCPFCKDIIIGITVSPEEVETTLGGGLPITVQAEYNDGTNSTIYGWTSNFNPYRSGLQIVTVNYGGYAASVTVWVKEAEITCPICGTKYPASEGNCPICREKVISISASPKEITVNLYETIALTVYATFADASIKSVTDWSIDCTTKKAGKFTATITYEGISDQISLTVLSLSMVTCPVCNLSYDIGEYPNGCPVCSKIITGIEAYLTSGSYLVQCGTTPDLSIILILRDTHREITNSGYIMEGYEPFKLGIQTVTVRYKEWQCSLDITVVDALTTVVCPNGHIYYLNEDGSDPGCPYCNIGGNHEIVYYYDITYLTEILTEIYTNGIYHFDKDNFITVRVTKKDLSLLTKIQKRLSISTVMLGRKKRYTYGGEVL